MKDFFNKLGFLIFILILAALSLGQLTRITVGSLVFYPHDILIGLFFLWAIVEALSHKQLSTKQIRSHFKKLSIFKLEIGFLIFSLGLLVIKALNHQVLPLLYNLRLVYYALFIYLSYKKLKIWQKKPWFRNWFWYFLVLLFIAGFGLVQYVLFYDLRPLLFLGWDEHLGRLTSTLIDPNFAGFLISVAIVYALSLKTKLNQKIWWLLMFGLSTGLILTFSRASYLTLIIGLTLSFIITQTQKLKSAILVLGLIFLAGVFLVPKPPGEGGKLFRTASIKARLVHDLNINCDEISQFRLSQIICNSPKTNRQKRHPEPAHNGYNVANDLQASNFYPKSSISVSHAHWPNNLFVFIYTQLGIVGLAWFIVLIVKWFLTLNKTNRLTGILFLMLLVHAQFNNTAFEPFVFLIFWGSLAEILRFKLNV